MSEPGYSSNPIKRDTSKLPPKSVSTSRENMRTSTSSNLSRMSTHRASYHETRSSFTSSSSKENVKENSRSREAVSSSTKKR